MRERNASALDSLRTDRHVIDVTRSDPALGFAEEREHESWGILHQHSQDFALGGFCPRARNRECPWNDAPRFVFRSSRLSNAESAVLLEHQRRQEFADEVVERG